MDTVRARKAVRYTIGVAHAPTANAFSPQRRQGAILDGKTERTLLGKV
ncbi:hypothetical protein COMA1_11530 [Candidatus Nitrospira nitrosa]|uniref:Uncharacterized protein n=1 Tax=Candidatus Nitrospira nitrosa TaxID=1742972 RepID=A0A0S4LAD5_9BACT|nr:hypothetical protein COMA1_11530 [Candidatus Nitrospira nitrosa]